MFKTSELSIGKLAVLALFVGVTIFGAGGLSSALARNDAQGAGTHTSQAADHTLYCQVRDNHLSARITTPAYYQLADHIEETDKGFALSAAGSLYPIAARELS